MRNTMTSVTIEVPVLMRSCHVAEKPNVGPVTAQRRMTPNPRANVRGFPAALATAVANTVKALPTLIDTLRRRSASRLSFKFPRVPQPIRQAASGRPEPRIRLIQTVVATPHGGGCDEDPKATFG